MWRKLGWAIAVLGVTALSLAAGERAKRSQFQYAGGTEDLALSCPGDLEVNANALVFKCSGGSIEMPFASIISMEYRPDLSRWVRKLTLPWRVKPKSKKGKRNRYFTIVFKKGEVTHVAVLKVAPRAMRPYLAQIDLKSDKRVEVMGHEEYY